jgi:hypothetical protein
MRTLFFCVTIFLVFCSSVHAENWTKNDGGKISRKEWVENWNDIMIGGRVVSSAGVDRAAQNNCVGSDKAMLFDLSILRRLVGTSFDVNRIYVDGLGGGERSLKYWLKNWEDHGRGYKLSTLEGVSWESEIGICIGLEVQIKVGLTPGSFKDVFLWYDGVSQTTQHHSPQNGETDSSQYSGPFVDTSKVSGALSVSRNGLKTSDIGGPGFETIPTDSATPGLPNFIGNKIELSNYNPKKTDSIKVRAQFKNIGAEDIPSDKKIESRFYLSNGYKEDSHSEWIRIGKEETKGSSLDPGETHWEEEDLRAWDHGIIPGNVYNLVAYIDRIEDKDNGDGKYPEEHKSDNCTTEAVFTVQADTPTPPSTEKFVWSSAGAVANRTCTQITEPADPHTWTDNFFCADSNYEIAWSSNGPIANMRCTQIVESADPNSWNDNYLCIPNTSNIYFSWSSAGPIDSHVCVQWLEAADPHTWKDNFLCYQIREVILPPPPPTYNISVNDISLNIVDRDKLWEDGFIDLGITVVNLGNNLPSNVSVGYYLDDTLIATHTISASDLNNNAYRSDALTDIPSPLISGEHTAKICVDSSNSISETDELDNCQSIKVQVEKHANPAVIRQLFN